MVDRGHRPPELLRPNTPLANTISYLDSGVNLQVLPASTAKRQCADPLEDQQWPNTAMPSGYGYSIAAQYQEQRNSPDRPVRD